MADSDSGTHISDITENSPEDLEAKTEGNNKALIEVIFVPNVNTTNLINYQNIEWLTIGEIFCKNFIKTYGNQNKMKYITPRNRFVTFMKFLSSFF